MKISYETSGKNNNCLFIKIVISAAVIIIAALLNGLSSQNYSKYDYISAFETIEAGISGEKNFSETVEEFCEYAFSIKDDGILEI